MIYRRRVFWLLGAALSLAACERAQVPVSNPSETSGAFAVDAVQALPSPLATGGGEPRLTRDPAGRLMLSWLEPGAAGSELALKYARLDGDAWTTPAVAARGDDWVVSAADLPSVQALSDRLLVADWRVPSPISPLAYDIRVAVSADAGATWSQPLLLNEAAAGEHGFVSWFLDGAHPGAVWLDGRDETEDTVATDGQEPLGTSLRFAALDRDGRRIEQGIIDGLVCDCCRTDTAAAAAGTVVVYRDRSATEIRDIAVRVRTQEGWSEPVIVGPDRWQISGCPVNGPAVDAAGNDIVVAWFTAADGRGRVRFARSSDGGGSFAAAIDVDADGAFGQVGTVLRDDGTAFVSWWRRAAAGGAELAVRAVAPGGDLGERHVVGTTAASRPDTVPQMALSGDRLVFVWTEDGDAGQIVKAAAVRLTRGG